MLPDAAAGAASREIMIEVLRYRSETDLRPAWRVYRVPFTDDMSVLQGLQYIKDHLDGTLSFRWSCRMAICGSCGMMIDAEPKLACMTFLRHYYPGPLTVEPLAHFPIERDTSVLRPSTTSSSTTLHAAVLMASPHSRAATALEEESAPCVTGSSSGTALLPRWSARRVAAKHGR